MRSFASMLSLALALAGCAPAGQCRLQAMTQTPLLAERGRFFTTIGINGHDARMIVDSGAFASMLSPDAIERYGVRTSKSAAELQASIEGIGGPRDVSIVAPGQIVFGRLSSDKIKLIGSGWSPPQTSPPTDGLLGADLLSAYDVDYDVLGGKLTLYKAAGRCDPPAVGLTGDLFRADMLRVPGGRESRAFVTAVIGGQEVKALLDTGAQTSVLFRGAASRLGLDYDELAAKGTTVEMHGIGPDRVKSVRQVLPLVEFGDVTIRNLPVFVADERLGDTGMLLGQDFLRKVHVWVSNSGRALIFQLPPQPSPPLDLSAR